MTIQLRSLRVAILPPEEQNTEVVDFTVHEVQAAIDVLEEQQRRRRERLAIKDLKWQKEGF